jgi:hypothetical protein
LEKSKTEAADYHKLLLQRLKEQRERRWVEELWPKCVWSGGMVHIIFRLLPSQIMWLKWYEHLLDIMTNMCRSESLAKKRALRQASVASKEGAQKA